MILEKRKELTLKEKIQVIKYLDDNHSQRNTASKFGISKSA